MLVTTLLVLATAPLIAGIFSHDAEVLGYAGLCLRIFSLGMIAWGIGMTITQAFNGAGDTMTPTWVNLFCFWMVQVPLAYLLAIGLDTGPSGVFWAVFVSDVLAGIVSVLVFRRGGWKNRMV